MVLGEEGCDAYCFCEDMVTVFYVCLNKLMEGVREDASVLEVKDVLVKTIMCGMGELWRVGDEACKDSEWGRGRIQLSDRVGRGDSEGGRVTLTFWWCERSIGSDAISQVCRFRWKSV